EPALRGRPAGLAGQALPAREPLHHVVVAALRGAWARHPEAGQGTAHDRRVDAPELVVRQAELARLVAAQVGVHGVARPHEVVENVPGSRVAEIERDALLAAVERLEEE